MPMDLRAIPDDATYCVRFVHERERLVAALGAITEGGVIESAEPVGVTSAQGLLGRPELDIALVVWPFPLEDSVRAALASQGYALDPAFAGEPEMRFHHAERDVHLYVGASGSPRWTDYLLMRDHFRHDAAARETYSSVKRDWSADG